MTSVMYKRGRPVLGLIPYALPGVTGLCIGITYWLFRLVMGFCYVDSDDAEPGGRRRSIRRHFSGLREDYQDWKFVFSSFLRSRKLLKYLVPKPPTPLRLADYISGIKDAMAPGEYQALGANADERRAALRAKAVEARTKDQEFY